MSTCAPTHTRVYITGTIRATLRKVTRDWERSRELWHEFSTLASCLRPCWRSPPSTYPCLVLLDSYISSFSRIRETVQSLFILTYRNIAEFAPHIDGERASTFHSLFAFIGEINFYEKMRKDLLKFNCRLPNDLCKFYAIFNRYCFHKRSTPRSDIQNSHFIRMPRFTISTAGLIASLPVPS